jgi:hypothetical protein
MRIGLGLVESQSIFSSCDRTGARSISSVRASQRRGPCHGHRVPCLAPALARASCASTARLVLAPVLSEDPSLWLMRLLDGSSCA